MLYAKEIDRQLRGWMKKSIFLLICLCCFSVVAFAQEATLSLPKIAIEQTMASVIIDGNLNEPTWQTAKKATNFWLQAPIDGEQANQQTEVQLAYNDKFIYIAATCWDDNNYIIQTLKRDNFGESDAFAVLIDPVKEQTNGSFFAVNALGAQTEALLTEGGVDDSWDCLLYTSPSPRDLSTSRMPSSA